MNTNKARAVLVGTAITAALIAGCGGSRTEGPSQSSSSAKPTTTTTTAKVSQNVLLDVYVESMQDRFPGGSRSKVIELGKTACEVIELNGSVSAAIRAIASDPSFNGMASDVGFTMGSAIPVFCPQYLAEMKAIVGK